MIILNLADSIKSDIKYKISNFPDGQQDIVIEQIPNDIWNMNLIVQINSPFNSFRDLELIICATKALRRLGVDTIHLYIPYLLGARSDRQFVEGGNSYLVDVIAPIINAQEYKSVTVIDVHSDVAAACIKNLNVLSNVDLVKFACTDVCAPAVGLSNTVLVSPDAGSLKKIYKVADAIGYKGEIITCSKFRDVDGKLSKTYVPLTVEHYNKDIFIIDDICDGGRTFINIVQAIQEAWPSRTGKTYLIVTHGIFSAGFDELGKYFDGVYCTTSVKWINYPTFIKQLNVY